MAGWFAHEWIAHLVLKQLSKKQFISNHENIDDFFFGAIAPDIRYINNSPRAVTHKPKGKNSIFEAMNAGNSSLPFLAGFETHLIVDDTWSNDNNAMGKSIYDYYSLDVNNLIHKFSLYLLVDDYFQGEADWFFQFASAGNILRATDLSIILNLGFAHADILRYKAAMTAYLREPGIDTFNVFNLFPSNFDETVIRKIADQKPSLTSFLKDFKKISVNNCLESLERRI